MHISACEWRLPRANGASRCRCCTRMAARQSRRAHKALVAVCLQCCAVVGFPRQVHTPQRLRRLATSCDFLRLLDRFTQLAPKGRGHLSTERVEVVDVEPVSATIDHQPNEMISAAARNAGHNDVRGGKTAVVEEPCKLAAGRQFVRSVLPETLRKQQVSGRLVVGRTIGRVARARVVLVRKWRTMIHDNAVWLGNIEYDQCNRKHVREIMANRFGEVSCMIVSVPHVKHLI